MSQSVVKRMAEQEVKVKITPAAVKLLVKSGLIQNMAHVQFVGPCKRSGRSFK